MKRLGAGHSKEWQKLIEDVRNAQTELSSSIEAYNTALEAAKADVEPAVNKMNEALEAARQFRDSIVEQIESYVSDRSEKWAESDAASTIEDWKQEWENAEIEDVELELPEALSTDIYPDRAEVLDGIPEVAE